MSSSPVELFVILMIVLLFFGSKRLRSLGSDLGRAIKGFKDEMNTDTKSAAPKVEQEAENRTIIDAEVKEKDTAD